MSGNGKTRSRSEFEGRLKRKLRVDTRFGVLECSPGKKFFAVVTDSISNAIRVSEIYQAHKYGFKIKLAVLPGEEVGRKKFGICRVGVAPVRRFDDSTSEQVTQVLYGESFDVLQIRDNWVRVRLTTDGYIGWVALAQVSLFKEDEYRKFESISRMYVSKKTAGLLEEPDSSSGIAREIVRGCPLAVAGQTDGFWKIKTPDGDITFVEKTSAVENIPESDFSIGRLLATAFSFKGVSYVWGGRSPMGFDCSGFIQTVFALNGIALPRDADLQFQAGKAIGKSFRKLRAGDLLFFSSNGDKISHVALYIGKNKQFIHSSGFVRVGSFDRGRKDFDKNLLAKFVGACRII